MTARITDTYFFFSFRSLFVILLLFAYPAAHAQSKKDLENKKKKLQKEISLTNQLLDETKQNKKVSLNQLVTLNKKISVREELIRTINYEIVLLQKQIRNSTAAAEKLKQQLREQKEEYARMIYYAYKNQDRYTRLMFIFSSGDFNQAYMRIKYLQQYADHRHQQADKITAKQQELNAKIQELESRKQEKKRLLSNEQSEKKNLANEKQEKEESLTQLQGQEKQLKRELEKKKRDAEKIQKAIQRIIEEELAKSRSKSGSKGEKITRTISLTPEARELSDNFFGNRGKLPWPVVKGIVIERFGVHPHPLMPGVEISNNGVNISTSKGTLARSVFEGEVTGIATIPGSGKVVIVRHGEYLSVYANLSEVYVKVGEKLKTKQNIGTVRYEDDTAKTELHLEIWKGQTKLDPEEWLFPDNS